MLLLVSTSSVASDYCWTREMEVALEQYGREERVLVAIIIRRTPAWHESKIGRHTALPERRMAALGVAGRGRVLELSRRGLRRLFHDQLEKAR